MTKKKDKPTQEVVEPTEVPAVIEQSTEVATTDYDAELAALATEAAAVERPPVSTIGTAAGVLTYNKTPVPNNKLDCIILASVHANMLYEGKYDPNNVANPVCYAYSPDGDNMVPHHSVVAPRSDSCHTCPMNRWGSGDGKGKACKNIRVLGLVPPDTSFEDAQNAEIAVLRVPVMSVKNFGEYVHKVATVFNRPPLGVVTTIGTQPDTKAQFKVTFTLASGTPKVSSEVIGALLKRRGSAVTAICREFGTEEHEDADEKEVPPDNGKDKKY